MKRLWNWLYALLFWGIPSWIRREGWKSEDTVVAAFAVVIFVCIVLGIWFSIRRPY